MLKKEVRDHIRKYVHPFRITNGQGFHLKDIDPADTCGVKLDKGEAAELLSEGTAHLAEEQEMLYAQDRWSLRSSMSCRERIRRGVRCSLSSSPRQRNSITTSCGVTPTVCPRAAASANKWCTGLIVAAAIVEAIDELGLSHQQIDAIKKKEIVETRETPSRETLVRALLS
jgi:hypothetical protein